MSNKSFEIDVNPKILKWARESIGRKIEEVAKRLNVDAEIIMKWEVGSKRPTKIQLEKIANFYKRPIAVFLLQEPPEEGPLPGDFRTFPGDKKKPFSPKILLAIRRAKRLASLVVELTDVKNVEYKSLVGSIKLAENPEIAANRNRQLMEVDIKDQINWKDEKEALDKWRQAIEKLGIFTLQISMPEEKVRGFSIVEENSAIIVVNAGDSITGKIFSLIHELCHILLSNAGVCDMDEEDFLSGYSNPTERFCNYFAGALLVPQDAILNHQIVKTRSNIQEWSDEILNNLSRYFKVSKEVILRRLLILNKTNRDFYSRKHEEWKEEIARARGRKKIWRRPDPPKKCIQEHGTSFVSLVIDKYKREDITYKDVADYLSIRVKYLPEVEKMIESKG